MRKPISQAQARRLIKTINKLLDENARLEKLIQDARRHWIMDYPGGAQIGSLEMTNVLQVLGRVEGARVCGHAVVCSVKGTSLLLYAVPQPSVKP